MRNPLPNLGNDTWSEVSVIQYYSFRKPPEEEVCFWPDMSDISAHDDELPHLDPSDPSNPMSWWPSGIPPVDDTTMETPTLDMSVDEPPRPPMPPPAPAAVQPVVPEKAPVAVARLPKHDRSRSRNLSRLPRSDSDDSREVTIEYPREDSTVEYPMGERTIEYPQNDRSRSRDFGNPKAPERNDSLASSTQEESSTRMFPDLEPVPELSRSRSTLGKPRKEVSIRSRDSPRKAGGQQPGSSNGPAPQPQVRPMTTECPLPIADDVSTSPSRSPHAVDLPGDTIPSVTPSALDNTSATVSYPEDVKKEEEEESTVIHYSEMTPSVGGEYVSAHFQKQVFCTSDELEEPECGFEAAYWNFRDEIRECEYKYLYASKESSLPWTRNGSMFVFPGGWKGPTCFWVDLNSGECFKTDAMHDILTDQELCDNWQDVEEADTKGLQSFVDEGVFRLQHYSECEATAIDCTWVRKWKKMVCDKTKRAYRIVKSRLCGRGFLDPQRWLLPTKSSTAGRLSHRVFLSIRTLLNFCQETWDIGNASLKGLTFAQIDERDRRHGLEVPKRMVSIRPPANVWRLLKKCVGNKIFISLADRILYLLELLMAMYGLNDGPLAFQFCLGDFYCEDLGAHQSKFDDCFFWWMSTSCWPLALASSHVGDNEIGSSQEWLDSSHTEFQRKFGKVKRQALPYAHTGVQRSMTAHGLHLDQDALCQQAQPVKLSPEPWKKPDSPLPPSEISLFRGIIGVLVWLCQTRIGLIADVALLQTFVRVAVVQHVEVAKALLTRAQKYSRGAGLSFFPLRPPLVLETVHDASHASSWTSYAKEAVLVLLSEHKQIPIDRTNDALPKDMHWMIGGRAHTLVNACSKAKRLSHSTSHAETNAPCRAKELVQLCNLRFAEVLQRGICLPLHSPCTLRQPLDVQEQNIMPFPVDHFTDCGDLYELITGVKGVPQGKSQRLYILSLRGDRAQGRIRNVFFCTTKLC